ncbi:pyridoxamine 5'-phosphate oxidase family protein [Sneathiella chungangensis]|uniref:Pyridoxamine 5'-phosphate oxidase family protein n=1 Tax=Sneathiella chungangensis TaxID=1418234 RepID=A0A845MLI3_9PROT|nr:pyridoxamine 5'-phosphate oxidase family protein [Sneathiella chungangensis]MZR24080.1 pyridoxamine 5'-phosphate oxidase family protein [Sneathiella chungangensis]
MTQSHDITTIEALEALYEAVNPVSLAKETPALTAEYRRWLEKAPFLALATVGPGGLDCSPRGDAAGQLFRILDDRHIALPDRRGNNRIDSLRNIVLDPRVALLFLIPGIEETLRINGRARITTEDQLIQSFRVGATTPRSVLLIEIDAVFFQCARALKRAGLWDPAAQLARGDVPTAGQMTKAALPDFDAVSYDAELPARQQSSLY